jgi:fatty-acid desaturase
MRARPSPMPVSAHTTRVMIPLHALGAIAIAYTVWHWQWVALLEIWLGWFTIGCVGVEVGLHREFAHRAVGLRSAALQWTIGWLACMGAQWSPAYWTALHVGYHHRHPDCDRDVHSPKKGLWHAYMGWMVRDSGTVSIMRAKHMLADPMHAVLHKYYLRIFWGSLAVLALVLPLSLFFTLVVIPILLSVHQENIVNVACHLRRCGYRNHETPDDSVNVWPLGILFWGQGFHNNHHARPGRFDFGHRWFELDSCRWVIVALRAIDRLLPAAGAARGARDRTVPIPAVVPEPLLEDATAR